MPTFGDSTVSVCTPVYNGANYIEESIRSVLGQSYTNFRLIVCDNCSTDDTQEIVRSFSDSRIKYSRNDSNLGLVGNANRCLELAEGDYIHFLHHDDIMRPNNLACKVRMLDQHPSVGFVHSGVSLIDQDGNKLDQTKFDADQDYIQKGTDYFEKYIMRMPIGAAIFIGAVMARRACYAKLGGFNPLLPNANDSEMWMRMLLFYDVACIKERLVDYRLQDLMTSAAISDPQGLNLHGLHEHFEACKIVIHRHAERIPNCRKLSRKVASAFAMRAIERGVEMMRKGWLRQGGAYLKTAGYFDVLIAARIQFWLFIMTLIANKIKK